METFWFLVSSCVRATAIDKLDFFGSIRVGFGGDKKQAEDYTARWTEVLGDEDSAADAKNDTAAFMAKFGSGF